MAKKSKDTKERHEGEVRKWEGRSPYGSHASLVVDLDKLSEAERLAFGDLKEGQVVCKDERGYYVTERNRLDSGLADVNRYNREVPTP